jgi:fructoselysine-6-P-deglycase FrlB-like protein
MRVLLSICALGMLTGCTAFGPQEVDADRPTVTYRYQRGDADQAEDKAERFCENYGLRARVVDTDREGNEYVSRFECI